MGLAVIEGGVAATGWIGAGGSGVFVTWVGAGVGGVMPGSVAVVMAGAGAKAAGADCAVSGICVDCCGGVVAGAVWLVVVEAVWLV